MTNKLPTDTIAPMTTAAFIWGLVVEPIVAGGAAGEAVVQTTTELVPIYMSAMPQLKLYHLERRFRAS